MKAFRTMIAAVFLLLIVACGSSGGSTTDAAGASSPAGLAATATAVALASTSAPSTMASAGIPATSTSSQPLPSRPPYDIASGPTPPCRLGDAQLPSRPFAIQDIGDIDGDHSADRAVLDLRNVSGTDWRKDIYIAYGSGATTGPLRGTYSRERPFGPKDIHGGVDLADDGGSDALLVAGDTVRNVARVNGTSRGHDLPSDMLTSGLDCLGVRSAAR